MTLLAYLRQLRDNHRVWGIVADDPRPRYSHLDLEDGLRHLRATCTCSPNQRSECTVCAPMVA